MMRYVAPKTWNEDMENSRRIRRLAVASRKRKSRGVWNLQGCGAKEGRMGDRRDLSRGSGPGKRRVQRLLLVRGRDRAGVRARDGAADAQLKREDGILYVLVIGVGCSAVCR